MKILDKILCYIPTETENSEKKNARKVLQTLKNSGYEVAEVNSLDDLLKCDFERNRYLVKIKCNVLNIRKESTVLSKKVGTVRKNEVYTITETRTGWGKLKSGLGWISLKYTERVM